MTTSALANHHAPCADRDIDPQEQKDSSGELMLWGERVDTKYGAKVVDFERVFLKGSDLIDYAFLVYDSVARLSQREPMAIVLSDDGEEVFNDEARFLFEGPYDERFGIANESKWLSPAQRRRLAVATSPPVDFAPRAICWEGDFLAGTKVDALTQQQVGMKGRPVVNQPFTACFTWTTSINTIRFYFIIDESEIPHHASICNTPRGFIGKTYNFVIPTLWLEKPVHRGIHVDPSRVDYTVDFRTQKLVVSWKR
jgi:hypothetical protein